MALAWVDDGSIAELRDHLWTSLEVSLGDQIVLNGHPTRRLPNTLDLSLRATSGIDILAAIPNLTASTGSACHAGSTHISPVLAAMRVPHDVALGAVCFSLGRETTRQEIEVVIELLMQRAVQQATFS